ncbi:MAG: diguanylate cyclase [Candidatus Competibacterales bacterium]|nr:diguanylate cyclase [Candidatus Competibacterales bacterium]
MLRAVASRIGLKVATVVGLVMLGSATAVVLISQDFAQSLGHRAADRSAEALRNLALDGMRQLSVEQAHRFRAQFERVEALSRLLATQAETLLAQRSNFESFLNPPVLRPVPSKRSLTNGPDAPVSVLYFLGTEASPEVLREIALMAQLDPLLEQARRSAFSGVAAWYTAEAGYVRYSPNLPLIDNHPADPEFQVLESPFYRAAGPEHNPQRETVWTRIYQDPAGQGLMITAATPVYGSDGAFRGVAGIDVSLVGRNAAELFREHLALNGNILPADQLFDFMVDGEGRIIAFPSLWRADFGVPNGDDLPPGEILEFSLMESGPPAVAALLRQARHSEVALGTRLQLKDTVYLLAIDTMPDTDWIVGHAVIEDAVLRSVNHVRSQINQEVTTLATILIVVSLALLGAALVVVISYVLVSIVLPLRGLARAAGSLRQGNYGIRVPVHRNDELGQAARAFNELSERLANLIWNLENRVAERTSEAEAARQHFQSILENSPVGIAFLDGSRIMQRVNPALCLLFGYTEQQMIGRATAFLYADESEYRRVGREAYPLLRAGGIYRTVTRLLRADGDEFPVSLQGRAVNPERPEDGFIWVIQDITEQKRLEAELQRLATHDGLTGIHNRAKLYELLDTALAEFHRYGTPLSVIMLDIDHFKTINDRLGHPAGDEVLRSLTRRVGRLMRETDDFGRWGGEEFFILARQTDLDGARRLAERIRREVADMPFGDAGTVTVSLGVVEYDGQETPEQLEQRVDQALYAAKERGRNCVVTG